MVRFKVAGTPERGVLARNEWGDYVLHRDAVAEIEKARREGMAEAQSAILRALEAGRTAFDPVRDSAAVAAYDAAIEACSAFDPSADATGSARELENLRAEVAKLRPVADAASAWAATKTVGGSSTFIEAMHSNAEQELLVALFGPQARALFDRTAWEAERRDEQVRSGELTEAEAGRIREHTEAYRAQLAARSRNRGARGRGLMDGLSGQHEVEAPLYLDDAVQTALDGRALGRRDGPDTGWVRQQGSEGFVRLVRGRCLKVDCLEVGSGQDPHWLFSKPGERHVRRLLSQAIGDAEAWLADQEEGT